MSHVGLPGSNRLRATQKTQQPKNNAALMGKVALITSLVFFAQSFIIWKWIDSITLKGDTIHTASDLLVNIGAFIVTLIAIKISTSAGEKIHRWFAHIGIIILALGAVWVIQEALDRFQSPIEIMNGWLIVTGLVGGAGNLGAHILLTKVPHGEQNHTHRVLSAHVLSDLALSAIVVMSAIVSMMFNWHYADPVFSLVAATWMLALSFTLFRGMHHRKHHHCDHRH